MYTTVHHWGEKTPAEALAVTCENLPEDATSEEVTDALTLVLDDLEFQSFLAATGEPLIPEHRLCVRCRKAEAVEGSRCASCMKPRDRAEEWDYDPADDHEEEF